MEEQNPAQNTPPPPEGNFTADLPTPLWQNKSLIAGIIVLLFIPLILVGTYKLGQNSQKPSSVAISTPTPTPTDETANWMIFEGEGFSFRYPIDYEIMTSTATKTIWGLKQGNNFISERQMGLLNQNFAFQKPTKGINIPSWYDTSSLTIDLVDKNEEISLGNETAEKYIFGCGADCYYYSIYFQNNGKYYQLISDAAGGGLPQRFEKILSTFKFTESSDETACTQDAKMCSDGSYVSREGPNCEFTACPTQ